MLPKNITEIEEIFNNQKKKRRKKLLLQKIRVDIQYDEEKNEIKREGAS